MFAKAHKLANFHLLRLYRLKFQIPTAEGLKFTQITQRDF